MQPQYVHDAKVLDIHDGDTIKLSIRLKKTRMKNQDLGFHFYIEDGYFTYHTSIRFNGINAPELNTPEGKDAKAYLLTLVTVGDTVKIETFINPEDKYGRWLGEIINKGIDLNKAMLTSGHAKPYDGQGPKT